MNKWTCFYKVVTFWLFVCLSQFVEGSFEKYLERLDDPKVSAFKSMCCFVYFNARAMFWS